MAQTGIWSVWPVVPKAIDTTAYEDDRPEDAWRKAFIYMRHQNHVVYSEKRKANQVRIPLDT